MKASTILDEAKSRLKAFDYDLAVRRSQEAFELYLKSLFRFLQSEYPAEHDLRKQIYDLTEALKQYNVDSRQVARLVLANSVLALWRSPAFYGDERLKVANLFDSGEAELAVSYAELAQFICGVVREYVYRQATVFNQT
jgi:HEPN domain-containing protein